MFYDQNNNNVEGNNIEIAIYLVYGYDWNAVTRVFITSSHSKMAHSSKNHISDATLETCHLIAQQLAPSSAMFSPRFSFLFIFPRVLIRVLATHVFTEIPYSHKKTDYQLQAIYTSMGYNTA